MTRNSSLISLTLPSGQKMKSVLSILSFLSLNTWITKHDKKDYKEQQVGGLQKGRLQSAIDFGLLSVTEWVRKCDMDCKVWQDDLQSVTGITKCKRITKGNDTMTPVYMHCLTVHLKYFMKKIFFNDWYHSQWIYNSRHYSRHFWIYILDKCSTKHFTITY